MERAAHGDHTPTVRLGAIAGVVGPIVFAALVIVGGFITDGYSHVSQKISELGGEGAQNALLQNINFIVLGLLVLAFTWALHRVVGGVAPLLIGGFGLSSAILNGVFQCDAGCAGETTEGLLHNVTGVTGFLAALVAMFLLSRRWADDPAWRSHVPFTRIALGVASAGLVWFIATQIADAQSLSGVAQRVFVGALLIWIATTAARLHRVVTTPTS